MQRIEDGALIISCDFCRTDWNGQDPVIEGHRGAILCLECLKLALNALAPANEDFKCVLCLREPIPPTMDRWQHPHSPSTFACRDCIHQAADVFDGDPDVDWTWSARPPAKPS
jgi:hypothetical protein